MTEYYCELKKAYELVVTNLKDWGGREKMVSIKY